MQLQNLLEIFNNRYFRVPDYQRGYSWGEVQLVDLWRDIDTLERDTSHYTGMLSVKEDGNYCFIIDGQQRITTLVIFIKVICDYLNKHDIQWTNDFEVKDYIKQFLFKRTGEQGQNIEMIFGYEKDNPSHIYFKTHILEIENTDDAPENTLYTKNLCAAKEFFQHKIEGNDVHTVETLLLKITNNLKFNFYKIEDSLNEFVAFETMNNRGKPLSALELLKNRLIYLSTLLNCDQDEKQQLRNDINNSWKTIYEYLGKNANKIIDDDDFLQDHWIMNFTYDRATSNVYKSFLLNDHFTRERILTLVFPYEEIQAYVRNIQKSVKHYYFIHNPQDSSYPDDIKKWLGKLNRLSGFKIFKPLLTVLLVQRIENNLILQLLKHAERFAFVAYELNHAQVNFQNSYFYSWAKRINHQPQLIQQLLTDANFHRYEFNLQEFILRISRKEKEFYQWKALKYFLYEYELFLKELYGGELKVEWERINKDSIEHICPQNSNAECWNTFHNQDLLHDLGNLLLLSNFDNARLGNRCFDIKKEYFSRNSFSAIDVSKSENWTPESVVGRRNDLLEFMEGRWHIVISAAEVDNLLNRLPPGRHDPVDGIVPISQLVRSQINRIIIHCEMNPEELRNLQNPAYSRDTFGIRYAFFKQNDNPNNRMQRYYRDHYKIGDFNYGLTTEWFEDNRELFLLYIDRLHDN